MTAALEQATAPFLLVGGTADEAWDGAAARLLSPHVFEVDGADHGMYVPGPLVDSIVVLGRMVQAIEGFLEDHRLAGRRLSARRLQGATGHSRAVG